MYDTTERVRRVKQTALRLIQKRERTALRRLETLCTALALGLTGALAHFIGGAPGAAVQGAYGATLLAEIFKANITVIRMILDRNFEPKPQLVHFESGLVELRHRVVLADSITLTPGTITCQLEGDRYLVHCLDEAMVDGLDNGVFVERLSEMEKKQKFMADSVTGEAELDGEKPEEIRAACEAAPAEQNPREAAKEEEHEH